MAYLLGEIETIGYAGQVYKFVRRGINLWECVSHFYDSIPRDVLDKVKEWD